MAFQAKLFQKFILSQRARSFLNEVSAIMGLTIKKKTSHLLSTPDMLKLSKIKSGVILNQFVCIKMIAIAHMFVVFECG